MSNRRPSWLWYRSVIWRRLCLYCAIIGREHWGDGRVGPILAWQIAARVMPWSEKLMATEDIGMTPNERALLLTTARILRCTIRAIIARMPMAESLNDLRDLNEALRPFDASDAPPINEESEAP